MDIIFFTGYGTKKETFMKKKIYKYLSKYGKVIIPDIDYTLSIQQNLENLNLHKSKYIFIGHSIGAYFIYKLMITQPNKIHFSIIFDGAITIKNYFLKELQPKSEYELLHRYSKEFYNMKKISRPLYFIRNLDTNNDFYEMNLWYKSCIKEAEIFEKNSPKTFHMFYVTNQGHNFYMTEKGFKTVSKILNLIFKPLMNPMDSA